MSECAFTHDAAAYVLGALEPAERADFEAHLADCPPCNSQVGQFTELPGVLAHAPAEELFDEPTPPPPADMLPNLIAKARKARFRRTLRSTLATAAAVALLAVGVVVAVEAANPDPQVPGLDVALDPVTTVSVTSKADMVSQNEGTRIELACDEKDSGEKKDGGGSDERPAYRLIVTNVKGETDVAGSWTGAEDGSTRVVLFSRWRPDNIAALEIQDLDEHALLRWQKT